MGTCGGSGRVAGHGPGSGPPTADPFGPEFGCCRVGAAGGGPGIAFAVGTHRGPDRRARRPGPGPDTGPVRDRSRALPKVPGTGPAGIPPAPPG
ncbi:hypothetical protein B7R87_07185 [Streptomyces tsukubensis]|uniref:Uncharacterized protein n=1 Tax=Streptomyces tsukubensis (strain DSM 42081 / NBRC 108919 / NRRL 18488 / 9993) TaxID=1114943 RepID=A0A7G3UI97_STRT9|nr:hypothetical protein B7R87_07185 [Streptomyces tsukubensis]QKM70173.1 hypothetical protein STSU_026630 [Streptomyces tsukubensis NRRL18488]